MRAPLGSWPIAASRSMRSSAPSAEPAVRGAGMSSDSGASSRRSLRAKSIEHDVHRQSMQPRSDRALAAKRRQTLPRPHESVLRQLASLALVARHAVAQEVDRRRVGAVQRLERRDVARLRAADDVVEADGVVRARSESRRFGHQPAGDGRAHANVSVWRSRRAWNRLRAARLRAARRRPAFAPLECGPTPRCPRGRA